MTSPVSQSVFSGAITFGDLLKQLRKRNGMAQTDLAAAVGYSSAFICDLELNRRRPNLQMVREHLIAALGLVEEPHLARRLLELAAAARGERLPPAQPGETVAHPPDKTPIPALFPFIPATAPTPLPASPTQLLGRDQEVKLLCNRLLTHNGRLLTLVGPPGIGKTSLALAVAEKLQELYQDGVFFIALAAVYDVELVAPVIINTLGIAAADERAPKTKLIDFLRHKQVLLLLDNLEQITAARTLVAEILANCPRVVVLATSRERLHLRAEQRYTMRPLAEEAALALFVQRAQAVASDFELTTENETTVAEICRLLDGLPLAIELSAAHADLFTPHLMLARLRERRLDLLNDGPHDLPPRQRTLRRAIHASYALLHPGQQKLFRALGVFAGGFTAEAAAALESTGERQEGEEEKEDSKEESKEESKEAGDEGALQALIHKSLVQVTVDQEGNPRFLLLETLRAYAWEQLAAAGETATIQHRHAAFYLHLAEEAAANLRGPTPGPWLNRLARELANLRAALAWSPASQENEISRRLGIALWRFWEIRGLYQEGLQWLEKLLVPPSPPAQRAKLLYGQAMLARRSGEITLAATSLTAALACSRQINDTRGVATALRGLGFIYYFQHNLEEARRVLEEALILFRGLDDAEGIAVTLDNLAYTMTGPQEAQPYFEESLRLRRQTGNRRGIAISLSLLTFNAIQQHQAVAARGYLEEYTRIDEEVGNQHSIALSYTQRGEIAVLEGDLAAARLFYEKGMKLCQAIGDHMQMTSALIDCGVIMLQCGEVEGVAALLEQALLLCQGQTMAQSAARALAARAILAMQLGMAQRALVLAGAAINIHPTFYDGYLLPQLQQFEQTCALARQSLDARAADAAWQSGRQMTVAEAIHFALSHPTTGGPAREIAR